MKLIVADRITYAETRQIFVYVIAGENGVPESIMLPPVRAGNNRKRRRVWPNCVEVVWQRDNLQPWYKHALTVFVQNCYGTYTSVNYNPDDDDIPQWILDTIEPYTPETQ